MIRARRILHPSDFSKASGPAFLRALELAKANKAELFLLHVRVPQTPFVGDGYVSPQTYQSLEASARRWVQKQLGSLLAKAKKAKVRVRAFQMEGVPYDQIARAAKSKRADLIVMGTHGRTGLSRFFMGSVAERVIPLAHCPVLMIRGK